MQKALKGTKRHQWQVSFFLFCIFQYGDTPLHTAARYGHAGVARILLSAASNPNLQNKVRNIFIITIYNVNRARVWCKIPLETQWIIWTRTWSFETKSCFLLLNFFLGKLTMASRDLEPIICLNQMRHLEKIIPCMDIWHLVKSHLMKSNATYHSKNFENYLTKYMLKIFYFNYLLDKCINNLCLCCNCLLYMYTFEHRLDQLSKIDMHWYHNLLHIFLLSFLDILEAPQDYLGTVQLLSILIMRCNFNETYFHNHTNKL